MKYNEIRISHGSYEPQSAMRVILVVTWASNVIPPPLHNYIYFVCVWVCERIQSPQNPTKNGTRFVSIQKRIEGPEHALNDTRHCSIGDSLTLCRLSLTLCRISLTLCRISLTPCRISLTLCRISLMFCRSSLTLCRISLTPCRISLTHLPLAHHLQ